MFIIIEPVGGGRYQDGLCGGPRDCARLSVTSTTLFHLDIRYIGGHTENVSNLYRCSASEELVGTRSLSSKGDRGGVQQAFMNREALGYDNRAFVQDGFLHKYSLDA